MEIAIQVLWWLGLALALGATLVILKQVFLVVGTLRDILHLTGVTRTAARGLAEGLAQVRDLPRLEEPALAVREAAASLARSAGAIERRVAALPREVGP